MKRVLACFVALFMLLAVGCTPLPHESIAPLPDEDKVSGQVEQNTPEEQNTTTTQATTTTKKVTITTTVVNKTVRATVTTKGKPQYISKDKAKAVAFERAGVNAKDVTRLEIELDYDDDRRIWEYELDFRVGKMEYEVSVNAVIGTITSFSKEYDAD